MKNWRITTLEYPDVIDYLFITANSVTSDEDNKLNADGIIIDTQKKIYKIEEFNENNEPTILASESEYLYEEKIKDLETDLINLEERKTSKMYQMKAEKMYHLTVEELYQQEKNGILNKLNELKGKI